MKNKIIIPFTVLLFSLFLSQCKIIDDFEQLGAPDPDIAVPLINSTLSIGDIVDKLKASDFISADSTDFISLFYRGNIFSDSGYTEIIIPDQLFSDSYTVPDLEIPDFTLTDNISLGEIANNLNEPERSDILNKHGTSSPLPPVPTQDAGSYSFNGNGNFTTATFSSGDLSLTIQNNLPITVENVRIELVNDQSGVIIATYNYTFIPANSSRTATQSLAGKTISSNLRINVPTIGSPGSSTSPVPVDTTDDLQMTFAGTNLVVSQATATIDDQFTGSDTSTFSFPNGEQIKKIILKGGILSYTKTGSNLDNNMNFIFRLPTVTLNGVPFEKEINLSDPSQTFDLAGYEFDLSGGTGSTNTLIAEYGFTSDGQTVTFTSGSNIGFTLGLQNLQFQYVEGYFGTQSFTLPEDTIHIDIYNNWTDGNIEFEDPRIDLLIRNSYGIPIRANFLKMEAYSERTGTILPITGTGLSTPIDFNYPTIAEKGSIKETVVTIDKNSSNITDVIAFSPTEVRYQLQAIANPTGVVNTSQFVLDTSHFVADVDVNLPLWGKINNMTIQDTIEVDPNQLERLDYAMFRMTAENGFPINARIQLYFLDASGNVIDSLFQDAEDTFLAASVSPDGKVSVPTKKTLDIPFDEVRFAAIKRSTRIIINARLQTQSNGDKTAPIKIYSTNYLKIKLGIKTSIRI